MARWYPLSPSHTQPGPWRSSPGCGSLSRLPEILRDGEGVFSLSLSLSLSSITHSPACSNQKIPLPSLSPSPALPPSSRALSISMLMLMDGVSYRVPSTQQSHHVEWFGESTARSATPLRDVDSYCHFGLPWWFPGGLPAKQETQFPSLSGRSPGGGNGSPLQHSCLGNPMHRGAWWATVHGGHKESNKV